MNIQSVPRITAGGREIETSPDKFGWLRDSTDAVDDFDELRRRMDTDGYLFLPGFLNRVEVMDARAQILDLLEAEGWLDPAFPKAEGIHPKEISSYFRPDLIQSSTKVNEVIYSDRMMRFYAEFLGAPATHFDYTWFRVVTEGKGTYPHCDVVYMGRGTHEVYTAWVPFGDVPLNVGGLVVLEGSHRDSLYDDYRKLDVDTACVNDPGKSQTEASGYPHAFGAIGLDISHEREVTGRRLLTCPEYRMGDLLTFSIYTVHGSLDNQTRHVRLSSDSRYQLASAPIDERWVGEKPPGHGGDSVRELIC